MNVIDTTYFISEPHQFEHQTDPTRWHNTFKFLDTTYNPNKNYSQEEVIEALNNVLTKQ